MARARQVVMVGDPKQLPPTNFFDRAEASDGDSEDVEADMESILDECLAASLPTRNLSWHYRSRHESLIAFSNHRYYGGGLVTFPSPVTEDRALSLHLVQGRYEKGGARINQPEARALVADLVARLKSPGFQQSGLTVGVVTFNGEQQRLIEDLLDAERRKDAGLEEFFSEVRLEPVFVKNLESVQGDERDIMYFSVTYGPDLTGAVSMNFGPLNRDGGERRLNVAVTRARHELRVFSSLRGDQMDLSRTQAVGVRDLKHFLEFAERGPRALAEAHLGSRGDYESPFEASVAAALGRKGWQVHAQIGASSFRVDLGVVHPDFAGRYLAGVECDGATYHRSATARDRDKLREQVLRGLGWEILRIWSTDWWINPGGTLERVHDQLNALLTQDRDRRAAEAAIYSAGDGDDGDDEHRAVASDATVAATPPLVRASLQTAAPLTDDRAHLFHASRPEHAVPAGAVSAERFFEPAYDDVLQRMVASVVNLEGPVLDDVLAQRIARAHGFQRTGSRIRGRVEQIAQRNFANSKEAAGTFYWAAGVLPGAEVPFRWPADDESARSVEQICTQEIVSLARWVLGTGQTGEDALIAMARELGLARLRAASRARLEAVLAALPI
jgi:very-short-patch-repair endonuclease